LSDTPGAPRLARRGEVAAEDAEFAGGGADFGEGGIETGGCLGFDVDEKLIFPGAAVDGTAFDLEEIDSVLGKGLEGGEERDAPGAAMSCISIGRIVSATIASRLYISRSNTRTTEPAREFSTGARSASAAPSAMAVKAASNVARGTVLISPPRSWIAAASLKA